MEPNEFVTKEPAHSGHRPPMAMNRAERRRYYRRNHKKQGLGTWSEFTETCVIEKPYVKGGQHG